MFTKSFLFSVLATLSCALPTAEPQEEGLVAPASAGNPIRPDWATIESMYTSTDPSLLWRDV